MVQLHPLTNCHSYMPNVECTSLKLGQELTFALLEDVSEGLYETVGCMQDKEGVLCEGPIEDGKSSVYVR